MLGEVLGLGLTLLIHCATGGQESSEGQSRIRRPIYQEEAARTVLSMPPPDSNSRYRALLYLCVKKGDDLLESEKHLSFVLATLTSSTGPPRL